MGNSGFEHRGDGFALPAALLTIIMMGALVTGGFYTSAQRAEATLRMDRRGAVLRAEPGCEPADSIVEIDPGAGLEPASATPLQRNGESCDDR